jgi:hypothetical protein
MADENPELVIETEDRPPSEEEKAQIAAHYMKDGTRRDAPITIPEDAHERQRRS